jgi:hypothetical protein
MFMHRRAGGERPLLPQTGSRATAWSESLAMLTWSVGSRELCQSKPEAVGEPVTKSNQSLRAPAQEPPFCAATLVVEGVAANVLERAI